MSNPAYTQTASPAVSECVTAGDGTRTWLVNGFLHREDGPASISPSGTKIWFRHGLKHRDHDLPAIEYAGGRTEWWINGVRHRDHDRPAIIGGYYHAWFQHGLRHRDGGPAVKYTNGGEEWWQHGRLHRLDGPATTLVSSSRCEWWIDDEPVTAADIQLLMRAQTGSLNDEDALTLLDEASTELIYPWIKHLIARNPSEFLSNRVRGLASLAL